MKRREFTRIITAAAGQALLLLGPFAPLVRRAFSARERRVLAPDTDLATLLYEDPAKLDARRLPVTPLETFGTMGQTDHDVDLSAWRLSFAGAVEKPLRLGYPEIKALPSFQRKVLLICPGVFAYQARWTGISLWDLLKRAGIDGRATHVEIKGPAGPREKRERFAVAEIRSGAVFLAHAVNGKPLPEKHGFPLRVVAGDHVGDDWVKYVDTVAAVIGEPAPNKSTSEEEGPAFPP